MHAAACRNIPEMHLHLEEEHWRRVEANAKARAAHLRASDFSAYLDHVEKQGDQHVDKLLQDSNSCLIQILKRLQKNGTGWTLAQRRLAMTISGRQCGVTHCVGLAQLWCTMSTQPEHSLTLSPYQGGFLGVHRSVTLSTCFHKSDAFCEALHLGLHSLQCDARTRSRTSTLCTVAAQRNPSVSGKQRHSMIRMRTGRHQPACSMPWACSFQSVYMMLTFCNVRNLVAEIHSEELNAGLTANKQNEEASSIRITSANWTALAEKIPAVLSELPDLTTELHPHQVDGLSWLVGLHDISFNGILADEMGVPCPLCV